MTLSRRFWVAQSHDQPEYQHYYNEYQQHYYNEYQQHYIEYHIIKFEYRLFNA